MKQSLRWIICLAGLICYSGQDPCANKSLRFFTSAHRINWEQYEVNVSEEGKKSYATKIIHQFEYLKDVELDHQSLKIFLDMLHLMDLNGDEKLDIIYEGKSGAESDMVAIFLSEDDKYIKALEEFQYVESLQFKNGQLCSITILDFGCCAEYMEYERIIAFTADFRDSLIYECVKPNNTVAPGKIFSKSKPFLTDSNQLALRSSLIEDDTSTYIYDAVNLGNVIAKYPKFSPGRVWAEQSDVAGNTWCFVEMYPSYLTKQNLVHMHHRTPPFHLGWMNSKHLLIKN